MTNDFEVCLDNIYGLTPNQYSNTNSNCNNMIALFSHQHDQLYADITVI